jgi:general stress protein 26
MSAPLKDTFWTKLSKTHVVLLGTDGDAPVPMSPLPRKEDKAIWFITSSEHDTFKAAATGAEARIYLCDSGAHAYGTVKGTLTAEQDAEMLDDLWSPMADMWFDNGREDDSVRLMKFTPSEAELWISEGSAKYLFETIRSNVTDSKPDVGDYGIVKF